MKHIIYPFLLLFSTAYGQERYEYSADLNKLTDDALMVTLKTPQVRTATAIFSFPKIIPGTYSIADYGKFISEVKAFDKNGKALAVTKLNENQWKVAQAASLSKITYRVDDIYDASQKHNIYPMAATNFEEGKNIVLNTPGIFGFIEGLRSI